MTIYYSSKSSSYTNIDGKEEKKYKLQEEYCVDENNCIKAFTEDNKIHYIEIIKDKKNKKYIIETEVIPETYKNIKDKNIKIFVNNYYKKITGKYIEKIKLLK